MRQGAPGAALLVAVIAVALGGCAVLVHVAAPGADTTYAQYAPLALDDLADSLAP